MLGKVSSDDAYMKYFLIPVKYMLNV